MARSRDKNVIAVHKQIRDDIEDPKSKILVVHIMPEQTNSNKMTAVFMLLVSHMNQLQYQHHEATTIIIPITIRDQ